MEVVLFRKSVLMLCDVGGLQNKSVGPVTQEVHSHWAGSWCVI